MRADGVVTDEESLQKHNTDWTGQFQGHSKLMLRPASVTEVSAILSYCNENRCARALTLTCLRVGV
jgi:(R)-2-hydroxyglutarate---pyruvate transhydrogenase